MAELWFLDLDGVRSGPYQTNEIMSLIAEGEILPHHRISKDLKNPAWKTILDWRLEQARIPIPPTKPAPLSPPSKVPPREDLQEVIAPEVPEPLPTPPELSPPWSASTGSIPPFSAPTPAQSESPSPEARTFGADAMAEMFDVLQSTKNKREARQLQSAQQAAQQSVAETTPPKGAKDPLGFRKLIGVCIGVAVIGLALGQWLKQSQVTLPFLKPEKSSKASPPAPKPTPEPQAEVKNELVDRSNEKMTIRTVVEKKPVMGKSKVSRPSIPNSSARIPEYSAPTPTPASRKESVDRELEELKDLKKELQELKSLKEQLKDTPLNDEFSDGELQPNPGNSGDFGAGSPAPGGSTPASPDSGDSR